jgi:uncharacterized protein YkwD
MKTLGWFLAAAALAAALPAIPPSAKAPAALVSSSRTVETTIALDLVNPHAPVSVGAEAAALAADLNAERARRGQGPLTRDEALDRIALAKGVDMAAQGYFGHTDPAGVTFQDRMRAAHWPTAYVAENIAFDRDEPHAHEAFVNSPGHYANMIDRNERRVGVAAVTVGAGATFYVQVFSGN